ncbi:MAG: hypothetical protein OEZ01_12385, partial [Candidatus Heimdallarchaeota archaeon]|nr:hypothetical protein [Candidatus Heimdallarchaeota archaeon]
MKFTIMGISTRIQMLNPSLRPSNAKTRSSQKQKTLPKKQTKNKMSETFQNKSIYFYRILLHVFAFTMAVTSLVAYDPVTLTGFILIPLILWITHKSIVNGVEIFIQISFFTIRFFHLTTASLLDGFTERPYQTSKGKKIIPELNKSLSAKKTNSKTNKGKIYITEKKYNEVKNRKNVSLLRGIICLIVLVSSILFIIWLVLLVLNTNLEGYVNDPGIPPLIRNYFFFI